MSKKLLPPVIQEVVDAVPAGISEGHRYAFVLAQAGGCMATILQQMRETGLGSVELEEWMIRTTAVFAGLLEALSPERFEDVDFGDPYWTDSDALHEEGFLRSSVGDGVPDAESN